MFNPFNNTGCGCPVDVHVKRGHEHGQTPDVRVVFLPLWHRLKALLSGEGEGV